MNDFPPRRRLALLVRSLSCHLPGQLEGLLDQSRFQDGAAALKRLTSEAHLEAAVNALAPEDAAWLAEVLRERWERIAPVMLEPEAAIIAPDELWVGVEPLQLPLTLATHGVEPGYEALWDGAVVPGPPSPRATLLAQPPEGHAPSFARVRAHVRASVGGQRCVLIAQVQIPIRRPVVVVSDDRRRLIVQDQTERPAVGVRLEIGTEAHTTGAGGLVELTQPAAPHTPLRVEGISAGRVPEGKP